MMEAETLPEVRQLLSTHASAYWDHHYIRADFSAKRETDGRESQNLIVINTVCSFLYIRMACIDPTTVCDRAGRFLEELKAEDNHIIRSWRDAGLPVRFGGR